MIKTNNQNELSTRCYKAPTARLINVRLRRDVLQSADSSWGEAGAAGAQGSLIGGDGEEDF